MSRREALTELLLQDSVAFWDSVLKFGMTEDHKCAIDAMPDTPDSVDEFDCGFIEPTKESSKAAAALFLSLAK